MGNMVGLQGTIYVGYGTRTSWSTSPTIVTTPTTATIWVTSAGSLPNSLTLLPNVRNVNIPQKYSEADFSSRKSGTKLFGLALEEMAVEIEVPYDPEDFTYATLRAAYMSKSVIPLAIMGGPLVTGVDGRWADFVVTDFPLDQPFEKEQIVKCTVKPTASAVAPQWVQVA